MNIIRTIIRSGLALGCILAFFSPRPVQAAVPLLSCRLESSQVNAGGKTALLVELHNVTNLYAYQLDLRFARDRVTLLDGDTQRSGVNFGLGDFLAPDFVALNDVTTTEGRASLGLTQVNPSEPRSGSGLLARIEVQGLQPGEALFAFDNVILADPSAQVILLDLQGCALQVLPDSQPTEAAQPTAQPIVQQSTPTSGGAPVAGSVQTVEPQMDPTEPAAGQADPTAVLAQVLPTGTVSAAPPADPVSLETRPVEQPQAAPSLAVDVPPAPQTAAQAASPASQAPITAGIGLGALALVGIASAVFISRRGR